MRQVKSIEQKSQRGDAVIVRFTEFELDKEDSTLKITQRVTIESELFGMQTRGVEERVDVTSAAFSILFALYKAETVPDTIKLEVETMLEKVKNYD